MQRTITHLVVMLFALTLLASGCAKKPVVDESAVMEETPQVEMQQQEPVAVVEQQVDEAAAAREAAEAAARRAMGGLVRIHFDFDQYVLTSTAKQTLANNAQLLKDAPAVRVQIEGHCDERGSDEYNLALGEKRALATKNYLVSLGVDADRMSVISYGEELPLDPTQSEAAWAKNRRAEFKARR
jgi:peptidoglycan-associated lipoprotein